MVDAQGCELITLGRARTTPWHEVRPPGKEGKELEGRGDRLGRLTPSRTLRLELQTQDMTQRNLKNSVCFSLWLSSDFLII